MGAFVISPLPPVLSESLQTAGPLRSIRITGLLRYCGPLRHPLAGRRLPGVAGIRFPSPPISRRGEEGFSSCLAHPCHRAVAVTPPECLVASVSLRRTMLSSPHQERLDLWGYRFEATYTLIHYDPMTRSPSYRWFCR